MDLGKTVINGGFNPFYNSQTRPSRSSFSSPMLRGRAVDIMPTICEEDENEEESADEMPFAGMPNNATRPSRQIFLAPTLRSREVDIMPTLCEEDEDEEAAMVAEENTFPSPSLVSPVFTSTTSSNCSVSSLTEDSIGGDVHIDEAQLQQALTNFRLDTEYLFGVSVPPMSDPFSSQLNRIKEETSVVSSKEEANVYFQKRRNTPKSLLSEERVLL